MIFEKVDTQNYPSDITNFINLFKISENIEVIGSLSYSDIQQFADIDLLEHIEISNKFTSFDYYSQVLACIDRIKNNGGLYGDIKCGTIERYKEITKYYGYIENSEVHKFNLNEVSAYINSIKINSVVRNDIMELGKVYLNTKKLEDYETFVEYIRNLYTIHWSEQEFRQFTKAGPSNEMLNIMDYIFNEPLKIDMIVPVNNNWIEISNIHNISSNGVPINFNPMTKRQIYKSIAENAEKFLFSPKFHNAYKGLKRCWILARLNEDPPNGDKFASLINSDVNNAYIAKSYLATFCIMLLNHSIVDLEKSKQNIKWLLSHVTSFEIPSNLIEDIDKCTTIDGYMHILHHLSELLNLYAQQWINYSNMLPVIQKYLYVCKNYEHNIII